MFFPTAGIEVFPLLPLGAAFVVSFFAAMGGFSGAFLLLPFQMSVLGFTNVSVSPTNQLYNVFANPAGFWRYWREGRMLWPLVWIILAGTLPGLFAGALIRIGWLRNVQSFKLFVAVVLLGMALQLVRDLRRKDPASSLVTPCADSLPPAVRNRVVPEVVTRSEIRYSFNGCRYCLSVPRLFAFCLLVGLVGGIYGIGGGAMLSPFLVAFFRLPVHTIAGATLCATSLSSIFGVLFYMLLAPFFPSCAVAPDWGLALLFGAGGFAGMYCGARCQKYVPAKCIKLMMLLVLLGTAFSYFWDVFSL